MKYIFTIFMLLCPFTVCAMELNLATRLYGPQILLNPDPDRTVDLKVTWQIVTQDPCNEGMTKPLDKTDPRIIAGYSAIFRQCKNLISNRRPAALTDHTNNRRETRRCPKYALSIRSVTPFFKNNVEDYGILLRYCIEKNGSEHYNVTMCGPELPTVLQIGKNYMLIFCSEIDGDTDMDESDESQPNA